MAGDIELVYWDSDVFLAFLDKGDSRHGTAVGVLQEISEAKGRRKVVTSAMSKVEVAFVQAEKTKRVLDPDIERRLDDLWNDDSVIEIIELNDEVAKRARGLMRQCLEMGRKIIKAPDAIHLASARVVGAKKFHTYNLPDFAAFNGELGVAISEPETLTPRLF